MLYTILMITFWLEHRLVVEKPYVLSLQFYICCFNTMTPDVFILHRCKHWQNRSVLFQKLSLERRSFSSGSCRHRELYARKGFERYELGMFLEFRWYILLGKKLQLPKGLPIVTKFAKKQFQMIKKVNSSYLSYWHRKLSLGK